MTFKPLWVGVAVVVVAGTLSGCAARVLAPGPPPAPMVAVRAVAPGPGFVWVEGFWAWRARLVWSPGEWARPPRAGLLWLPGRWRHVPGGWRWEPGRWR